MKLSFAFFFYLYIYCIKIIHKLYIQYTLIHTYIQIPFLCRVTAVTRHMRGSTVAIIRVLRSQQQPQNSRWRLLGQTLNIYSRGVILLWELQIDGSINYSLHSIFKKNP